MAKVKIFFKRSYIFLILGAMYIPLFIGVVYSFSQSPKKGGMSHIFNYTGEGWNMLWANNDLAIRMLASLIIALIISSVVVILSLLTVYGLWRSKSRASKIAVIGTYQVPLINPDIITAIALMLVFGLLFGTLKRGDVGLLRVIISQTVMIIPFGITIMYPRSEKFAPSLVEASKDLGYGPIRTWFKTYFRHMLGVMIATFVVSMALSFDDFIITKTTSRVKTIGIKMYSEKLRPWVLALGTISMTITIGITFLTSAIVYFKNRKGEK